MNDILSILEEIQLFFDIRVENAYEDDTLDENEQEEVRDDYLLAKKIYEAFRDNNLKRISKEVWESYRVLIEVYQLDLAGIAENGITDAQIDPEKLALVLHNLSIDPEKYLHATKDVYKHTDTGKQQELGDI